jgi:NAD(P)-dependent dehydrogenase (short-subunit alcohol dehydrogenase family)/predicted O-methyltransferase YrrM
MAPTNGVATNDIHATGVPDTPVEVVTDLLGRALQSSSQDESKSLIQQAYDVIAGLDPYLEKVSTPPNQVCQELIKKSVSHDWKQAYEQKKTQFLQKKECCAGALEGSFLKSLVRLTKAKTVLEVGMFTGTSSLAMAEAIPADGKVYCLEIEPYMQDFAQPAFKAAGVASQVEVVVGPASEGIDSLAKQGIRFDIAFLDADKTGYLGYYKQLMDKQLIVPGGIIVVDNALMKGRVYAPGAVKDEMAEAIREFNEFVIRDDRVEVVALPFRDGVNIVQRKRPSGPDVDDVITGSKGNSILQRFKLNSKVALITGAGQGIGRAFAHALGEAGAAVAVVDVNKTTAEQVVKELSGKGVRSIAVQADVTKKADCKRMVETVVQQLGGLHIAVNNAGINKNAAAEDTTEQDWDLTFDINTKGVFLCCQEEGKHMLAQGYGKIINTASMATLLVPHPQKQIAYNASKAAVVKITQTLGTEWADRGLNVNCISPGILNTALIQESKDLQPLVSEWLKQIPAGRLAEVTDLQAAIVFMASDASNYMVGHNLVIEGGQSIW